MARDAWDPFKDLLSLQERMNQLFEESLARRTGQRPQLEQWHPPVDIIETDDSLILTAEVPGLQLTDIALHTTSQHLTIRGERLFAHGSGNEQYHQVERACGKFERVFILPDTVNPAGISAALRDGVLEVTLPKRTAGSPHDRPVRVPVD